MNYSVVVISLLLSSCVLAITTQESELLNKWIQERQTFSAVQRGGGKVADYIRSEQALKDVTVQSLDHAFADPKYDCPDSFLAALLGTSSISHAVASKVCQLQFPKVNVSNNGRGRLCNFMIQTLYESRSANTNYCDGIQAVLLENDYPEVYSDQTKDIIRRLILEGRLHFSFSAVVGIAADKDIKFYLSDVMNGKASSKGGTSLESWVATCILAKVGDKIAYQKVEDTADGLTNWRKAMYVPLGMAYIGDKTMTLKLFNMLNSDLKKCHGEDAMPCETQLAHEAAAVLSFCVKTFPKYKTNQKFTPEDKAKCLKWVEENKDTFVIENRPPLFYFRKTRFVQVGR